MKQYPQPKPHSIRFNAASPSESPAGSSQQVLGWCLIGPNHSGACTAFGAFVSACSTVLNLEQPSH